MKKRKLELQLEYLELKNYKMKLEVMALETTLRISPSKFTKGIHDTKLYQTENAEDTNEGKIVFVNENDVILNKDGSRSFVIDEKL